MENPAQPVRPGVPPADRLYRLSGASRRINQSLDFDTVLQGAVDSASDLTCFHSETPSTRCWFEPLQIGNKRVTIPRMIEAREYVDDQGRSPFGRWFDDLDAGAAVRVRTTLARMEAGNLSNVRGVGSGVLECRINVGPGYRVYFGRDGDALIILLGGGTKVRQQRDIEDARELWQEYRRRKQEEV